MNGMKISQLILEYKHAYENAGIQPSAYRLTCKEHKALCDYLPKMADHKTHRSMIAEYYGVTIEVVMIVDPYI